LNLLNLLDAECGACWAVDNGAICLELQTSTPDHELWSQKGHDNWYGLDVWNLYLVQIELREPGILLGTRNYDRVVQRVVTEQRYARDWKWWWLDIWEALGYFFDGLRPRRTLLHEAARLVLGDGGPRHLADSKPLLPGENVVRLYLSIVNKRAMVVSVHDWSLHYKCCWSGRCLHLAGGVAFYAGGFDNRSGRLLGSLLVVFRHSKLSMP